MTPRTVAPYSEFLVNESLDQVKSLMPKMGLDYKRMISLPPSVGEPADLEEVIAHFYRILRDKNKLGHMTLVVRMVNDLRVNFEDLGEPADPVLTFHTLSSILDRYLKVLDRKWISSLRHKLERADIQTFLRMEDGAFWTSMLAQSLSKAIEFREDFMPWVMTWPHKPARDMVIRDSYYNLENLTCRINFERLATAGDNFDRWVREENGNIREMEMNLYNNLEVLRFLRHKFRQPKNQKDRERFKEKLPGVKTFPELVRALLTVEEPDWNHAYWSDLLGETDGVEVLWDQGDRIMVRVDKFEAINKIAWFTMWCIRQGKSWVLYNDPKPWTQFVLYDFNKDYSDPDAILGFTADPATGKLRACHNRLDKAVKPPPFLAQPGHGRSVRTHLIGTDISMRDAVSRGDVSAVEWLLEGGADLSADGFGPLADAVSSGQEGVVGAMVGHMVENGATVDPETFRELFLRANKLKPKELGQEMLGHLKQLRRR
jgi:hypothetical protein